MSFFSRLFGNRPAGGTAPGPALTDEPEPDVLPEVVPPVDDAPPATAPIACPSCGVLIDPPPVRNRRCPRCREPIVVRRTGGRTVYLTEAAVLVFEDQRRREANAVSWTAERAEWLRLARGVGAAEDKRRRIEGRPISEEAVEEARALYLSAATKAAQAARRARAWDVVARILREWAAALYREAGSPVPPPEDIAAVHADGMTALLRSLRGGGTHAEVVGGACCAACRADDGRAFAILAELRSRRLPHAGCPRGLCPCEWWVAGTPKKRTRRRRPAPA
jgi:hypothetical protein